MKGYKTVIGLAMLVSGILLFNASCSSTRAAEGSPATTEAAAPQSPSTAPQTAQPASLNASKSTPGLTIPEDSPTVGAAGAPVTIVEFSDFQCPACKSYALETLPQIMSAYDGSIEYIYRYAPAVSHAQAQKAAEAAQCAFEQGKFWEYHDALYQNQRALDISSLKAYAAELGLDQARFDDDLDSGKYARKVQSDFAEAIQNGVVSIPTFFVNGRKVVGAQSFSVFDSLIREELGKATPAADSSTDGGGASPTRGPETAAVTIEEFSDFQCPYSGRFASQTLPLIFSTYGDRVHYVFRSFPLTQIHPGAEKAAEAAMCALEQGKFWEYHDLLFRNQSALDTTSLKRMAGQLGLEQGLFDRSLDSGKYASRVQQDISEGRAMGVTGTPTLFINGRIVSGAQPFSVFQQIIDDELEKATTE